MKSLTIDELDDLTDSITAGYLLFLFDATCFTFFIGGVYFLTLIWSWASGTAGNASPVSTPGVDAGTIMFYVTVALYMFVLRRLQDALYYAVKVVNTESDMPLRTIARDLGITMFRELFRLSPRILPDLFIGLYVGAVWFFGQQCFLTNYVNAWYTTTMQWPGVVQDVACTATTISTDIIQAFFEITNIEEVVTTMTDLFGLYFRVEEWRIKIRGIFQGQIWKDLNEGCTGTNKIYTFRNDPITQTAAAVVAVTAAIACFSFFRVTRKLLSSMIFWMFGITALFTAIISSQLFYDLGIMLVYLTVPGTVWVREYTPVGYAAIYAGAMALVFAVINMIVPALAVQERTDMYRVEQQMRTNVVTKTVGAGVHYTKALVEFFFSETFIFVVISALLLIYIWLSRFPIQAVHFNSLNVTKYPSYMDPALNPFESYWFNYQFTTITQLEIDVADFIVTSNFNMINKLASYLPSIPGFTIPNYCMDGLFSPLIAAYEGAYSAVLFEYNNINGQYAEAITIGGQALDELENAFSSKRQFIQSTQQALTIVNNQYNFIAGLACSEGGVVASKLPNAGAVADTLSSLCNEFLTTEVYLKMAAVLFYGGEDLYNEVLSGSKNLVMGAASTITGAYDSSLGWAEGAYKDVGNDVSNFFNHILNVNDNNTRMHLDVTRHHLLTEKLRGHILETQESMDAHHVRLKRSRKDIDRILHRMRRHTAKLAKSTSRFHTKDSSDCGISMATVLNEIEIPFPKDGLSVPSISLSSLLQEATGDLEGLIKQLIGFLIPALNVALDDLLKGVGQSLEAIEGLLDPIVKLAVTLAIDLYQVFDQLHLDLSWIPSWVYFGPLLVLVALVGVAIVGLSSTCGRRVSDTGMMNGFLGMSGLVLSVMFSILTVRVILEAFGYTFVVYWRSDVYVWLGAFVFIPLSLALLLTYESTADTIDPELLWLTNKLRHTAAPVLLSQSIAGKARTRMRVITKGNSSGDSPDSSEQDCLLTTQARYSKATNVRQKRVIDLQSHA